MLIAFLWGFAEATLFFFVPDVWLTYVAIRRGLKPALLASLAAMAGALVGGTAMYLWSTFDNQTAREILAWVPAISPEMIDHVASMLRERGVTAIFLGPLGGIPYKIYAVEAAAAGISISTFLAISGPARIIRFLFATIIAWAVSVPLSRRIDQRVRILILIAFWTISYIVYFIVLGI